MTYFLTSTKFISLVLVRISQGVLLSASISMLLVSGLLILMIFILSTSSNRLYKLYETKSIDLFTSHQKVLIQ